MSLTSYRAAPPRVGLLIARARNPLRSTRAGGNHRETGCNIWRRSTWRDRRHALGRPGNDLLSRALRHSTIGARGLHGRVRNGIGCGPPAIATRSSKRMRVGSHAGRRRVHPDGRTRAGRAKNPKADCRANLPTNLAAVRGGILAACGHPHRTCVRGILQAACNQAYRAISTGQLHVLPRFHTQPINVVVFHGSQARPRIEGGFPLRCFQRLSLPHLATRRCRWRDNRYTRGASTPVLSY
jgi:hypothetical protein